uniref:Cyclic nucleotide-regulated small mechanosensitive ion channel n=1 Tax=Cyanothece sp. (strain PCC 7425 / ATCC 29141) TaxID=395961 RepID=B8HPQ5_CYAP4
MTALDNTTTVLQGLAIILGLPLLVIGLGELIERSKREHNPFTQVLTVIRNLLFPPLALWLLLRQFFQVAEDGIALRVVGSLFWVALIYLLLLFLNTTLTAGKQQKSWQLHLPNLLFQLLRALVVLGILAYVLGNIWQVDLTKIMGALGIGSLVIALALQDTLSNLVSGFLLIIESPFKVGDWIKVGELEGEVIEINWRAVRIKTLDKDIIIIPNGNLGKENICNYTLHDPLHVVRMYMPISYEEHPDRVIQVLQDVALSVDGIEPQPLPDIDPQAYKNSYIEYEIRFCITDYSRLEEIKGDFFRRAYYAIHRNQFHIPFPDKVEYRVFNLPQDPEDTAERLTEILRSLPLFSRLDSRTLLELKQHATLERFAVGERIIDAGTLDQAFYILLSGQVMLSLVGLMGEEQEIAHLTEGDFLGEMVFLPGETSPVYATVTETAKVIRIAPVAIVHLIQHHPKFAVEMSQFIEERKKWIRLAHR